MAICGIGVDMEKVSRFENASPALLNRIFTESELSFCLKTAKPAMHLAARFCAKEAAFKALPFDEISFKNIEVLSEPGKKPRLKIHDKRADVFKIDVSLSHTDDAAIAFVIVSGD
ncbi:MAG: holo-ACP synthase [Elusimicrobia bacterium]|nr:holo-ACP synthase [Elusimicrobiota bacterium]